MTGVRKNAQANILKREEGAGEPGGYYGTVRADIVALVPPGRRRVLEVGCGDGSTLHELKKSGKAVETVGVDVMSRSQDRNMDRFILCDIESAALPYPEDYFDVIICADVIEHLRDPLEAVKKLKRHLKRGGLFIYSMPNIREMATLVRIALKGDFRYEDSGVLDRTHLRFFCKRNIVELGQGAGLDIKGVTFALGPRRSLLHKLTLGLLEEFLVVRYIVCAEK